jgi:hypothetical protein
VNGSTNISAARIGRTFPTKPADTGRSRACQAYVPTELAKTLGFASLTGGTKSREIRLATRREPVTTFQ